MINVEYKKVIVGCILLIQSVFLFAQPLCTMKQYSIADGYVHGRVNDLIQSRSGIIWLCTRDGLTQFDGYTFKNIKSYPGDDNVMESSNITWIKENSVGNIWCRNQDGHVYLYDVGDQIFYSVIDSNRSPIEDIFSLPKGITWITCKNGNIYRIDDELCKSDKGEVLMPVNSPVVHKVIQDSDGDEWLLSDKGVSIFGKKSFQNETSFTDVQEIKGAFWLISNGRDLAKYDKVTQTLRMIGLPKQVSNIWNIRYFNNDTVAIGTSNSGLFLMNVDDFGYRHINVDVEPGMKNTVASVYRDSHGDIWMSNNADGILYLRQGSDKVIKMQSPPTPKLNYEMPNKYMVREDCNGVVWTIPRGGNLCYFDRQKQVLKYYYTDPNDPKTIVSPFTRSFFFDRQNNFWIDDNQLLVKLSFFSNDFKIIPKEEEEIEVRSLLMCRNGNVWVGTKDRFLKILDKDNNCIGYVTPDGKINADKSLFVSNVYSLMEDSAGNIWAGTRGRGLYKFTPKSDNSYSVMCFMHDPLNKFSISNSNIFSIKRDHKDRIWIATYGGGLNLVDQSGDSIIFINHGNLLGELPSGASYNMRCIAEVGDSVILAATSSGLVSFSSNFNSPEEIRFFLNVRKSDVASLTGEDIFYVYSDKKGNVYAMVRNGGINRVVSDNLLSSDIKFESFTERDGLLSDQTLSMIEDTSGGLWIISKQLISRYFPEQRAVEHFTNTNLHSNTVIMFSEATPVLTASGNIAVGTYQGILEINPYKRSRNIFVPKIVFTDLLVHGERIKKQIRNLEKLTMNPSQRNLSLQFAALDFREPKEIQYAYKMEGIDKYWNYVGRERAASYINLAPGTYRFLVRSTNSDGIWVDNTRELSIIVKPKFLETAWAWLLFGVIAILLTSIGVFILFTIYRLKHEVKMEQKMTNLKLNFFTEISHELRTPLTLISSPVSEILENEQVSTKVRDHLTIVKNNADRMLRMVNQILDFRKIQSKKMTMLVEEIEVVSFVTMVMDNFQLAADEKQITFNLESSSKELFLWVDKDKLEKIVFNLLSNAFKYTPQGKSIKVDIVDNADTVFISVKDKGIGIKENKIGAIFEQFESLINSNMQSVSSGIGLSLVKELVEMHHGTIDVSSQMGEGSEFKVSLHKGNAHFTNDPQVEFIISGDSESPLVPQSDDANSESSDLNKKWTILIVEDDNELRNFLRGVLSKEYIVIDAPNGSKGFEKACEVVPDIIVSDVVMPVMNGLDMVKQIKENRNICHIPIILLSAKDTLDDRIRGLENGIDDYIAKPFSASYLRVRIRTLIKQRESLQVTYMSMLSSGKEIEIQDNIDDAQSKISPHDDEFIKHLMAFMDKNIDNADLSVEDMVDDFSMSRTVFFKKMKMLLGMSPNDFVRDMRIKNAAKLIAAGSDSLSDIAYRCGFSDPNYFTKCFKKLMGVTPSEYRRKTGRA